MTGRRFISIGLIAAALVPLPSLALDFLSVAESTVLFDAPSAKAKPRFVVARDTPLEMVVAVGAWIKVRDREGDLSWIEKSLLSAKRTVIVSAERCQVLATPTDSASLVFEAERDVVLDLLEPGPAGWAKVKHRDGQQGYVKVSQVWGL